LRDNETDVQKWLEFIAFQDKAIVSENDKIQGKSIEIVVSEKKLSVCEKALKSNPKSIELLLCRLEILSNMWEFERVDKEWKKLTFLYPNSMDLWRKYLRFSRQNITYFTTNKTIKIYQKCISILSQMLEKTFQSHSPPEDLEKEIVSIISSYCYFLESIGHTERAVSTFQALIEFNLFTPSLLTFEMSVQVMFVLKVLLIFFYFI
jgi:tetratricopeptide (TPR) repeat protein